MTDSNRPSMLRRILRWWQPYLRCGAMSPEGLFCDKPQGHEGLHAPAIGDGWAWGDYR